MSYSSGISGGSNLYEMLRYRQAMAGQQASAASGQPPWANFSQGASTTASSLTSASQTAAAQTAASTTSQSGTQSGAATAKPGSGASLTSQLSNLLMEFQQVLGQMGQDPNGQDGATGSGIGATSTDAASDTSQTTAAQTAAAQTAPTQPRHRHHHHQSDSQSTAATDGSGSNPPPADPAEQLLGTTASTSDGTITQSAFEQAFANGADTSGADKIFAKLDKNGDGTIDQSEAQNALKQLHQPRNAAGMQSPSGTRTGGQGNSSQGGWLSGSNLLFSAQQMGQAA